MILVVIIFLILGMLAGTITGLIPGIHLNLVGAILISYTFLEKLPPEVTIVFIISMSITHTFLDFIPSIFLGAPDDDTALSILPGHDLLKKGKGYEAIYLTTIGSLFSIPLIILMSLIFLFILNKTSGYISLTIPYLLILSSIFLISQEKLKLSAIIIFLLSGFLGLASLNLPLNQPFLPLLSGLFGASTIIISIKNKTRIPKQEIRKFTFPKFKKIKTPLFFSLIASSLCSVLPGIGAGQAAVIGSSFKKLSKRQFLILLGATNTIVLGLSFIVFYTIGRTRTGMASFLSQSIISLTQNQIIILLTTIIIIGIINFYWTMFLGKLISKNMDKIPYKFLNIFILGLLTFLVIFISGFLGLLVFIVATAVGIFGILSNVRRINLMGVLVIPTIIIYLI